MPIKRSKNCLPRRILLRRRCSCMYNYSRGIQGQYCFEISTFNMRSWNLPRCSQNCMHCILIFLKVRPALLEMSAPIPQALLKIELAEMGFFQLLPLNIVQDVPLDMSALQHLVVLLFLQLHILIREEDLIKSNL